LLVLDRKEFEKLTPEDQAVVREVMGQTTRRLDEMNRADNEKARQALASQGIEFVQPEGAELDRWREIADQATAQLEKEGEFSTEMYGTVSDYLTEFRDKLAQQ